ncbi:MAG: sulfide-dependent adenosine diphosphate thiazole synthase [Candidatus Omnitrophica bacterium]|nr:sulfide-dependent adenosine diphosphate thiazole synthase [Candidatus Omnitrophota bacterium]MCM8793914.1 sulfide-dependent adenosine diphosphate thiazole synthase [Candidatus Omnitrophota bacterium]
MIRFEKISEEKITQAIVRDFSEEFIKNTQVDVLIAGGGPAGLMAGKKLAEAGIKVLIVEANNYLGGGFWIGGYLMNILTFRSPAEKLLDELGIPYREVEKGLFTASGPYACAKLITSACEAGVKIVNMTKVDDVVIKQGNRVGGLVINWSPVSALPRAITCVDPVALESRVVIDATGHDAVVCEALNKRGLLKIKGFGPMWVEASEDLVVEKTGEVHPGLIVAGMAVATVYGLPRMGPTFGAMLYSGVKAAEEAKRLLLLEQIKQDTFVKDRALA